MAKRGPSLEDAFEGLRFVLDPFENIILVPVKGNKVEQRRGDDVLAQSTFVLLFIAPSSHERTAEFAKLVHPWLNSLPVHIRSHTTIIYVPIDNATAEIASFCARHGFMSFPTNSLKARKMYPGASDSLLEKREYADGIRYVPATSVVSGVSYYVQRKDDQGRDYYLNTNPTPVMSNVAYQPNPVQATYAPQSVYATGPGNYAQISPSYTMTGFAPPFQALQPGMMVAQPQNLMENNARFGGIAAAHIVIGILSLFLPFFYIIAFPILFVTLKKEFKAQNLDQNPYYSAKLSTYTGVGWTAWVLVLIGHFFLVCGWANVSTYVCHYDYNNYWSSPYPQCHFEFNGAAFGIGITGSILTCIAFILHIVLLAVGATWIKG